jgi:hypothetical protein
MRNQEKWLGTHPKEIADDFTIVSVLAFEIFLENYFNSSTTTLNGGKFTFKSYVNVAPVNFSVIH